MTSLISKEFLQQLAEILDPDQISDDLSKRIAHARDLWSKGLLEIAVGQAPKHPPDLVLWPKNAEQIQKILPLCQRFQISITAFGAGSGVCGAAVPSGGIILNLTQMNRILTMNRDRSQVICEPGVLGNQLETKLNRQGFTLGHFPSSIICSTVGGWVATRGAGQCSTRYGKIEDLIQAIEFVTADGELMHLNYDAKGPDFLQLLCGSEGTLGILTQVTLALRPLPQQRHLRGWSFSSAEVGNKAIAALLQAGLRPAIVRLYDELDSFFSFSQHLFPHHKTKTVSAFDQSLTQVMARLQPQVQTALPFWHRWLWQVIFRYPKSIEWCIYLLNQMIALGRLRSVLILGFEGERSRVAMEETTAEKILLSYGAKNQGSEPGRHWLAHRYELGFKLPKIFSSGAFVDTMEVATTWSHINPLYQAVKQALAPYALVLAHFSHAYKEGCSIYFTFLSPRKTALLLSLEDPQKVSWLAEDQARYNILWNTALEAVIRQGGTISHHHGVGLLKSPFLPQEHGESIFFLQKLKQALDPEGILNPGKFEIEPVKVQYKILIRKTEAALSSPSVRFIHPQDLYCEVDADLSLFDLETSLNKRGFTLGPLPPWSYQRSLSDALANPFASEASPGLGTLRDRCLRLTIESSEIGMITFPRNLSPKRATGPDLKAFFLGSQNKFGLIRAATLRILPIPSAIQMRGWLFDKSQSAFQVLFQIRDFYAALGPNEIQILSHQEPSTASNTSNDAALLVVRASGLPSMVHSELTSIDQLCSRQQAIALDERKTAQALFPWLQNLPKKPIPAPNHEQFLLSPSLADIQSHWDSLSGPKRICGVHLHGLTLCSEESATNHPADLIAHSDLFLKRLRDALSTVRS